MEKVKFKDRIVKFVTKFQGKNTFKTVARMIKTDLPRMLGYERCELFLFDVLNKNLYSTAIDEEADAQAKEDGPPGFELDYIIQER